MNKKLLFLFSLLLVSGNFVYATSIVQVLVVGGGAGGGAAAGGGAGQYQYDATHSILSQSYSVIVGAGGSGGIGGSSSGALGSNGGNSVFDSIISIGGGGGGQNWGGSPFAPLTGASGGGSAGGGAATVGAAGTAGNNGGDGFNGDGTQDTGGGGGGAGSTGGSAAALIAGNGGDGSTNSISGSSVTYAGGGGGSYTSDNSLYSNGGSGGSGVVIISYPTGTLTATGGIITTSGSSTIHTFTTNGTFTVLGSSGNLSGSGTTNRLAKFTASSTIGNSLLSDNGVNTTLTSGNLFTQSGTLFDTVSGGVLNFGTTMATTMNFGSTSQNMIINSKVGIGTSSPTAKLHVNGDFFANLIKVAANGLGIDTFTSGVLSIGSTTASAIRIGRSGITTSISGILSFDKMVTSTTCNSTTTAGTCGSSPAGSIALSTGTSTILVNTTAVTANSQILITEDSSLGNRLGITCNTTTGRIYKINTRVPGSSFTIRSSANPTTNKACLSYWIIN